MQSHAHGDAAKRRVEARGGDDECVAEAPGDEGEVVRFDAQIRRDEAPPVHGEPGRDDGGEDGSVVALA